MNTEILLTLKLNQQLFADPRRIALLRQIQATGSISQGAKLAHISYKSAWDAINEMNTLAQHTVVEPIAGGKGGGGTIVTPYGQRLLQLYELLRQIQQKAFDVLHQDDIPLDSLLGAIARFSLQTSARNQFFGTIIKRDKKELQQHVSILLADKKTEVVAAITQSSANRLALTQNKEVLVLIKAPWINLTQDDSIIAENKLTAKIDDIQLADDVCEVILGLAGNQQLCATISMQQYQKLGLSIGKTITAYFDADKVIIATLC